MTVFKISKEAPGLYTVSQKRRGLRDLHVRPVRHVPRADLGEAIRSMVELTRGEVRP